MKKLFVVFVLLFTGFCFAEGWLSIQKDENGQIVDRGFSEKQGVLYAITPWAELGATRLSASLFALENGDYFVTVGDRLFTGSGEGSFFSCGYHIPLTVVYSKHSVVTVTFYYPSGKIFHQIIFEYLDD